MTESMDSAEAGEVFDSDGIRSAVQEILISIGEAVSYTHLTLPTKA